jgi:hypothetical protein
MDNLFDYTPSKTWQKIRDFIDKEIELADIEYYEGEGIDWLRRLRNKYVHYSIKKSVLESNDFFDKQEELEKYATIAIKMVIKALFQNPFIQI